MQEMKSVPSSEEKDNRGCVGVGKVAGRSKDREKTRTIIPFVCMAISHAIT